MDRTAEFGPNKIVQEPQAELSFLGRKGRKGSPQPTPNLVEGNHLMRNIDRAPPGDIVRRASKTRSRADLPRQKSMRNFFEDAFSTHPSTPARERVHGDAIVMAEVKTNVIISDEFTFITELSYQLSTRYQRPVSSIVVTLHHGACMIFGGSFEPAYILSVFALPSQLLPTTNKRNAALIQKHMEETLAVAPARGFLRFVPTQEEHLACNGKTMAGEIDELEKSLQQQHEDNDDGVKPPPVTMDEVVAGETTRMRARKMLSVKRSLVALRHPAAADIPTPEPTPPGSANEALPRLGVFHGTDHQKVIINGRQEVDSSASQPKKSARRTKSFMAGIFGRSGRKSSDRSSLPTIADE
ncbi:Tautomerase/MIF superfamily [Chaetomium strumarium]|uniref:L-dopachrome isomerase n=1 Tax=Chaetomium strumarium TaxID=1170767 RepID=A0AAJ0GLM1_9PEZI|nr:Tautomerase/MIF superfamily [Chaetomium strumarium]